MKRLLVLICLAGCNGTTGSGLVTFTARAGGPADANGALEFDSGSGFHIALSKALFHIGAVYLTLTRQSGGLPEQSCILLGVADNDYVGEAFGTCNDQGVCGLDFDLLSPDMVPFQLPGQGTANPAAEGQLWLSGSEGDNGTDDINAPDDPTPILDAAGTATKNGQSWPFTATVTIGQNRQMPPPDAAEPGANPICRQRIVSPVPVDFSLSNGGTLDVRVDPSTMFDAVDFSQLTADVNGNYAVPDDSTMSTVGNALYKGVVAYTGYHFSFAPKP